MKRIFDQLGFDRMTLTTKFTVGILFLTVLMLAASVAGLYGVSRVETLLSFVTGPAWDAASGSYRIRSNTQKQMLKMGEYTNGRLELEAVRNSMSELDAIIEHQINSVVRSGLVPEASIAELIEGRSDYSRARAELSDKYQAHMEANKAFGQGLTLLKQVMDPVRSLPDGAQTAALKMQIALLDRARLYRALRAQPHKHETTVTQLLAHMEDVRQEFSRFARSAPYQATMPGALSGGRSYAEVLAELLDQHERQLNLAVTTMMDMVAANREYQSISASLLNTVEQVQEIGEKAMVGQGAAVVTARTLAYALVLLTLIVGLGTALFLARYLSKIILAAFRKVVDVSEGMRRGDLHTIDVERTGDEVEYMMIAMKGMVDTLEARNEQLNNSVIQLMGSVLQLSQRDLTTKVTVAEDVTGPVADSLNLMTSETAKVLITITGVSHDVEQAANAVKAQAEKVMDVARRERLVVEATAKGLHASAAAMTHLAQDAQAANETAGVAMSHTRGALDAVASTVNGIEQIRDVIREAEKRIKRLGERSQEITSAVNLINTIAERTHILALNASMHAASAGEAGRGFAVVADEVQRLAESSRAATSDISSMVNNIRLETADTVTTMNHVITQVAEGTRLAADAGKRMQETEETTTELVTAVEGIATRATKQAKNSSDLEKHARVIVHSTTQTREELKAQAEQMQRLVQYSLALRDSVGVFKLPEGEKPVSRAA